MLELQTILQFFLQITWCSKWLLVSKKVMLVVDSDKN